MQIAYYANYFVWFEVGRCDLLRSLGKTYRALESDGLMLPVIDASCEYRRPVRYDDDLTILTRSNLLSAARVQFEYEVQRQTDRTVAAVGRTVHAAVNLAGRPVRLPAQVREMLA